MSVLILSNSAPNYHYFFNSLAKEFSRLGEQVVYAVDSDYSRLNNRLDDYSDTVYVFSDFFKNYYPNENILNKYKEFNLNYALLSDHERAEIYGVWKKSQYSIDYFNNLKGALLQFFEDVVERHEPKMIIYENVSNTFSYFAYLVSVKKEIPYKGFSASRLPERYEISGGPFDFEKLKEKFEEIRAGDVVVGEEVQQSVRSYINRIESIEPDYMKSNKLSDVGVFKRYLNIKKIIKLVSLLKYSLKTSYYNFQIGNPLKTHCNLFLRNLKRNIKCRILRRCYDACDSLGPFFLYPLHFHPESSTSILSGNNLDEYEVIRSIAFNLPEGAILYVKDHKSAWGYPSLSFYRKLKRLPNVKLLHPDVSTKELIKNCCGVATLTSTVGYEALLMGKPVLLFGRVFYEFHKNVYRIGSRDDIHEVLENMICDPGFSWEEYNEIFVQAYWLNTYPGPFNVLAENHLRQDESAKFVSDLGL